jgi:hypothetical protein
MKLMTTLSALIDRRRQQNQKFPSFQIFRLAAGGVGGAANKNERKFLGFAPRELVERGRGAKVSRFVQNAFEKSYIIPQTKTDRHIGGLFLFVRVCLIISKLSVILAEVLLKTKEDLCRLPLLTGNW